MHVVSDIRGEGRGGECTHDYDVYTTPKEISHIDFPDMNGRFRLEFRFNTYVHISIGRFGSAPLVPVVVLFFSNSFSCMQFQISFRHHASLSLPYFYYLAKNKSK